VEYIAFGEVLFEEHSSSFSSPYLFNGKELDRETNLSYYGARYLDMKTSLWLNMDKETENDLSISGYVYSFNNPINLTDPDGNWPDLPSLGNGLLNRAKSVARNYVADKVSNVVSNVRNYAHQKSKGILNAMTPNINIGASGKPGSSGRDSGYGGYDFRSDLKRGEDTSGKVQKGIGDRNTQIVDITGLDILSTYAGLSTGTKKISSSGKIVDAFTDIAKVAKSYTDGFSLGQDTGEMYNQATDQITMELVDYSASSTTGWNRSILSKWICVGKNKRIK